MNVRIELFLESRQHSCCPSTLATYRQCLEAFGAWLGARVLDAGVIDAYLDTLKARKLASDSQRNAYRMLKTYCRWLVEYDLLDRDPFVGRCKVTTPALKRNRRKIYNETEIVTLLQAEEPIAANKRNVDVWRTRWSADGPYAREQAQGQALVLLAVDSALRAGEICALTCDQIRKPRLLVVSKGGHLDAAFITASTRAVLLELAYGRPDEAPLFRNWDGERCSVAALRGLLQRLAKRASVKLPPRPLHAFRHYAARQWLKSGLEDLTIRQLMRHSQLSTTAVYTQLDEDELDALHEQASPIARLMAAAGLRAA
jgi:site-specific recombinase XerD